MRTPPRKLRPFRPATLALEAICPVSSLATALPVAETALSEENPTTQTQVAQPTPDRLANLSIVTMPPVGNQLPATPVSQPTTSNVALPTAQPTATVAIDTSIYQNTITVASANAPLPASRSVPAPTEANGGGGSPSAPTQPMSPAASPAIAAPAQTPSNTNPPLLSAASTNSGSGIRPMTLAATTGNTGAGVSPDFTQVNDPVGGENGGSGSGSSSGSGSVSGSGSGSASGSGSGSGSSSGSGSGSSSGSDSGNPEPLPTPTIYFSGGVGAGQTNITDVVGDNQCMVVNPNNTGGWTLTSYTWSVNGESSQSYTWTAGVTTAVNGNVIVNINVGVGTSTFQFYWDQNIGKHTVTVTPTYTNMTTNATSVGAAITATANILAPQVNAFTDQYQPLQFGSYNRPGDNGGTIPSFGFHQGVDPANQAMTTTVPGDQFAATVSAAGLPVGGQVAIIQLITARWSVTENNQVYNLNTNGFVVDNSLGSGFGNPFYLGNNYPPVNLAAGANNVGCNYWIDLIQSSEMPHIVAPPPARYGIPRTESTPR